jgi:thymidine phosphorylase
MRFKVKRIKLSTGWPHIAILERSDATALGLHPVDRVKLSNNRKSEIAILDVSSSSDLVKKGEIGVFDELSKAIGDVPWVKLSHMPKPASLEFIKKKMEGYQLTRLELLEIVKDITLRNISDVELTYFVSACAINMLTDEEIIWLTEAMIATGEQLSFRRGIVVDKHCIGGIPGNRTTMLITPIIAANGLLMPKTSSRSVTSPAGTADTMEVLCEISIPVHRLKSIVKKVGGCVAWGGEVKLAPADDQIINIEHPLSIDSEGQMLASVIAKKASVGSKHLLIDIPYGPEAKCRTHNAAKKLGEKFLWLGEKFGMNTHVAITDGSQPIGNGIGPALEAIDVMKVLENHPEAPLDLKAKVCYLAGIILEMVGKAQEGQGFELARATIESGRALEKMNQILDAQGRKIWHFSEIKLGKLRHTVRAKQKGEVSSVSVQAVSEIAKAAGAPLDNGAGVYLYKHVGDTVKRNDILFCIYAVSKGKLDLAVQELKKHKVIGY